MSADMVVSIASGHTASYLTREVSRGRENYYTDAVTDGEPPGRWFGAGAAALGLVGEVDNDVMTAMFSEGPSAAAREAYRQSVLIGYPLSGAELARQFEQANPQWGTRRIAEVKSGKTPQRVAFHDVTFSVPKSVSVVHTAYDARHQQALRDGDTAAAEIWADRRRTVEDAIWAGNNAMLTHLEDVAGYARAGRHTATSGRWVDAHRLVVASFFQHTSRANDPQLHIHNAIRNEVVCDDGKPRTLDGRLLYQAKDGAGALAERVMHEHMTRTLGTAWRVRPDGVGLEAEAVPQRVMDAMSSRTPAIGRETASLVDRFRDTYDREPSAYELNRLRQQATLRTRPGKSHGDTREGQLDQWSRKLRIELNTEFERITDDLESGLSAPADEWSPAGVALQALAAAQAKRSAFTRSQIMREVAHALPAHLGTSSTAATVELIQGLTDAAMSLAVRVTDPADTATLPADLTLANGSAADRRPGAVMYATTGHLAAERALRRSVAERGRESVSAADAGRWVADNVAGRWSLGGDQAAAVSGLLTSGAAVSVLVGPAGAGKSRTMGAYAEAWSDLTGGRVFGLATSEAATRVLADDGVTARNISRWLAAQKRLHGGTPDPRDEPWRLSRIDTVVIDEASMVDTSVIEQVRELVDRAGGRLILAGDPKQLAAVGAGGGMALVTDRAETYHLTEVRRFDNRWEADASLQLRAGDRAALDEYDRRGRILDGGTAAQAGRKAARAYVGDVLAGKNAVIVTATNGEAATVAAHVREHLAELGRVGPAQVILGRDGNDAGDGDLVQARHNDWGTGVINRGRYVVKEVREDGSMVVRAEDGNRTHTLPAAYVAEHVTLGYAGTVHAVEGVTVQRSHSVASSQMSAEALYVAATRGSESNTIHVATRQEVADAPTGETAGREPRTPAEVLGGILEAERETTAAALDVAEQDAARAASMATIQARQETSTRVYGELRTEQWLDQLTAEGALSEPDRRAFAADQGTAQLARLLRTVEQAGHDPQQALRAAITGRPLDDARSVAQVVHHRITQDRDLTPQLEQGVTIPVDAPAEWRAHFASLSERADDRRRQLGAEVAADPPRWALDTLGPVPDDVADRLHWEDRAGRVAAHREATGHHDDVRPLDLAPGLSATERRASWFEAWAALGRPATTLEEQQLSEGALRNRQAAWERERAAAPPPIFEQQRTLGQQIARYEQDAAILAARAAAADDQAEADQLRQQADDRAVAADIMRERAVELEQVRETQAAWYVDTAVTRELGERAEAELAARGVPMGDEPDRVTAEEWLAAHRAADVAEDPHREIHEVDVAQPELVDVDQADTTTEPPARESNAATDVAEHQPVLPRGVPSAAEVDAATQTARLAAERLADRASAEQATRRAEDGQRAEAEQAAREQAWRTADVRAAEQAATAADDDAYST